MEKAESDAVAVNAERRDHWRLLYSTAVLMKDIHDYSANGLLITTRTLTYRVSQKRNCQYSAAVQDKMK